MIAGLTGGIGSGKSMVARLFEILGCAVFNSDQAAREVYFDPGVKKAVITLLGHEAYSPGGINKPYISARIFGDTLVLHQLNAIIHPAVKERFRVFVAENKECVIIKETALLFEANLATETNKVIVVAAADELRIGRVMRREGWTREEVIKRMKSQLPQAEKVKKADYVITNNEQEFLIPQVLDVYRQLST